MEFHDDQVDEIFCQAVEFEASHERAKYLDHACGNDYRLRARVERLLAAQAKVRSFLESPAPGEEIGPTTAYSGRGHANGERPVTEKPGTRIGPYKLLQKLGEGGMGVVYMAEQSEPVERRVALKIIKPGMDTRQVIARFEAERQALAMMDHPGIAHVVDAGTTDSGRPFFAMELVKGIPITQYCDEHRLTVRERLSLFVDVCHAVQHAHQKGIIHRDIKPSNVLVAEYDDRATPKIIDFGVAKAIRARLTDKTMFTQMGQVVGTLEYMSPEQAKLNQLDIDTRSDIYSLGVLLYELLTGETPFDRKRLRSAAFDEMLRILREEDPPKPSMKVSTSASLPSIAANRHVEPKKLSLLVRGELDWIVMKAMEKERSRRYDTANAFASDVSNYLNDEPVIACPPSSVYRFRKFARRHKGPISIAFAAILLLLAVATGSSIAARSFRVLAVKNATLANEAQLALAAETRAKNAATEAQRQADAARRDAENQRANAERGRVQAEWNQYVAQLRSLADAWQDGNYGELDYLLDGMIPEDGESDFRHWEWYYFRDQVDQRRREVSGPVRAACWSRDGAYLAVASNQVELRDADTLEPVRTFGGLKNWVSVAFSPNSQTLAAGADNGTVDIWDVETGQLVHSLADLKSINVLAFSPDSKQICAGSHYPNGEVCIWTLEAKPDMRRLYSATDSYCFSVDWHPKRPWLASAHRDGMVRVWEVVTGKMLWERPASGIACWCAKWSPDGSRLLAGGGVPNHRLSIWNEDGDLIQQLPVSDAGIRSASWSPDGTQILWGGRDHNLTLYSTLTNAVVEVFEYHASEITGLDWNVNDQVVSVSSTGSFVFRPGNEVLPAQQLVRDGVHSAAHNSVAWSPDGSWIAFGRHDGTLQVLTAASGQPATAWKPHDAHLTSLAWRPNGTEIASIDYVGQVVISAFPSGQAQLRIATSLKPNPYTTIAWSVDGRWLASGGGPSINNRDAPAPSPLEVWNADSGELQYRVPVKNSETFSIAADSRRIALFGSPIRLEDIVSGSELATIPAKGHSYELTFNPQGTRVAVSGVDGGLMILDVTTQRWVAEQYHQGSGIDSVAWSHDGSRIATGGGDGSLVIWNAATLEVLLKFPGDKSAPVRCLAWSPDDRRLLAAGVEGVMVWGSPSIGGADPRVLNQEIGSAQSAAPINQP